VAAEPIWTVLEKRKIAFPCLDSNPDRPAMKMNRKNAPDKTADKIVGRVASIWNTLHSKIIWESKGIIVQEN